MESTLLEPLADLIKRTAPSYESASRPREDDIVLCGSPKRVGRMLAIRAELKKANNSGVTDIERAIILLNLDILDKDIRRSLIVSVLFRYPNLLEGRDPMKLRVTQKGQIVYPEK